MANPSNPVPDDSHTREREARLQAILDAAVEAIITIDQQGICESANNAVEKMFGYSASELIGQNISILMPEPYSSEHDGYLKRYLDTGVRKIIGIGREAVGRHKSGHQFPIHLSISEIIVDRRRLFTGIIHDITEQKDSQRRLVQSERLAVLGEAMARLAHESRNALQRIQIAVETARIHADHEGPLTGPLDAIERANDALNALLEEVRNYATPLHLERKLIPLASTWTDAMSAVAHKCTQREVDFAVEQPHGLAQCNVDRFRMGQVFRNLLENSLSACSDPVRIEIRTSPATLGERQAWRVVVSDNGPGLDEQQARRVFEPFFTTKAKGTGLGMAITKRIVEAHEGQISVATSPVGGAVFEMILPV